MRRGLGGLAALTVGLSFAALIPALVAAPLSAQAVTGIVVDARTGSPVTGTSVVILDSLMTAVATATSGDDGRWGVALGPDAGPVFVGVSAPGYATWLSPALTELHRGIEARLVRVGDPAPAEPVEVTPAEVASWCGPEWDPVEAGVVVGRVQDTRTGEGLSGLEVLAEWGGGEIPRLIIGGRTPPPYRSARSGDDGLFLFCALPAGEEALFSTRVGTLPSDSARVVLQGGSVHRIDLNVGLTRPGRPTGLFGTVVDATSGEPVAGALLEMADGRRRALTNERGFFVLDSLPPGLQLLRTRHLAYADREVPVVLQQGQAGQVRLELSTQAIELEPMTVTVRSHARLRDMQMFDHRRSLGFGTFYTRESLEKRNPWVLADVLRDTPGVQVRRVGGPFGAVLVRSRGRVCAPNVWVDGQLWRSGSPLTEIMGLELEAVEVYRSTPPPEFFEVGGATTPCATVVAWTRRGR